MSVPGKAAERIRASLKRFHPILSSAKARDINESDTVVIVTDLLQYLFGYDKYTEITSEHMIRSTFCDLAINLDGSLAFLLEVKAIGHELKDSHVKQAVDYAANKGCEWVGLTNGVIWRVYKVVFSKPIEHELVVEVDLLQLNSRDADHIELIGLLAKEGWQKARLGEYHSYRQALSRFTVGATLLTDTVIDVIRRELRRASPGLRVEDEEIRSVLTTEVIKREVLEGDKAVAAQRHIARSGQRSLRKLREREEAESTGENKESEPVLPVPQAS
jgi:predicted type IV restriction endonuclease